MSNKIKLKKGYNVIIIAGKDKGKTGEITKILPSSNKVVVSGINTVKKHMKPSRNNQGGIVQKEMPLDVSNVAFLDVKTQKASRIGYKVSENGERQKISKRSGEAIL